jgi:hypothetical protein
LNLLPEKYRAAIVLCDLEGRPRKEAARLLKVPEGTLSSRLATARRLLAARLSRRGVALSGGALAAAMAEGASAAVPAPLVWATARAAANGLVAVSPAVGILVKGALKTMLMAKLKLAVGAAVVLTALGASGLAYRAAGQAPAGPKRAEPRALTELELLRKEVDVLKLQVDLMQEKLRAQGEQLRALRTAGDAAKEKERLSAARKVAEAADAEAAANYFRHLNVRTTKTGADPTQEAEAALKALREAKDEPAKRRAADDLDKAVKKLRQQLKPAKDNSPQKK